MDLFMIGYQYFSHASMGQRTGIPITRENEQRYLSERDDNLDLNKRVDRLTTLCEAMWGLLSETTGLTNEELQVRFKALDLSDGIRDGHRVPTPRSCSCGAKVNPRSPVCIFCSSAAPEYNTFDQI